MEFAVGGPPAGSSGPGPGPVSGALFGDVYQDVWDWVKNKGIEKGLLHPIEEGIKAAVGGSFIEVFIAQKVAENLLKRFAFDEIKSELDRQRRQQAGIDAARRAAEQFAQDQAEQGRIVIKGPDGRLVAVEVSHFGTDTLAKIASQARGRNAEIARHELQRRQQLPDVTGAGEASAGQLLNNIILGIRASAPVILEMWKADP